jgi:hypothetical protein
VLYHDPVDADSILIPRKLLERGCAEGRQVMLKMAMGLEDRPEYVGHREDDADKRCIR